MPRSWWWPEYGMAPAQIPLFLSQKPIAENGQFRVVVLRLAWLVCGNHVLRILAHVHRTEAAERLLAFQTCVASSPLSPRYTTMAYDEHDMMTNLLQWH